MRLKRSGKGQGTQVLRQSQSTVPKEKSVLQPPPQTIYVEQPVQYVQQPAYTQPVQVVQQ